MPRYVVLVNWTEQGLKNVKETLQRTDSGSDLAEKHGLKLEQAYSGPSEPTICSPSSRHRRRKP
jgi:uncharacterized protein with GYD domain